MKFLAALLALGAAMSWPAVTSCVADEALPSVDSVLAKWEEASQKCRSLDASLIVYHYDYVFSGNRPKIKQGRFYYEAPNMGRYETWEGSKAATNDWSHIAETMIWNGRETLQIDGGMKTCNRVSAEKIESLLKVLRAERGTAEAKAFGFFRLAVRQFARMLQGPEQFLPLMVNVHAAEVRKRFDVTITPHKKGIVLEAVTKDGRDKTLCREIDVLLDVETYRTCATRVIAPNGKDSTVYVLDDQKLDHRPSDRDELMEPDLTGLRVMENDGSVLRFPRPSVAKKEWFGGSTERPLCPLLCKQRCQLEEV